MSNKRPPDFTKDEVILITATLRERYGRGIEVEQTDAEIRLNPAIPGLTECPIVYWEADKCHFIIARADKHHCSLPFLLSPLPDLRYRETAL